MPRLQKRVLSSDGRASEVFRTAAQIILEKGYDATSVADIATALGITKAGLYHYIHGKTQLLYDIMQYGMDELDREVVQPAREIRDAEERLRFMVAAHARIVTRGQGAVTILVEEGRALTPAQNRNVTRRKRAFLDFLRATLDELKKEGKLRNLNTTVAAFNIIAMVCWPSRWYQTDGALTEEQVAEQIVDMALNGLIRRGLRAV
jgi:AcrR family transcriptional regulator